MKEKQPLISVIIPVYNGEAYVKACIDSIEGQTQQDMELVIVNDGSTDQTAQICEGLLQLYTNITIINMDDKGVSAARNAALDKARGSYITFVDADDRMLPHTLEILYDMITQTGCEAAGCGFAAWKTNADFKELLANHEHENRYRGINCCDYKIYEGTEFLKKGILNGDTRCWGKLYHRAAIGDIRFREDMSIGEDMLFLVDALPGIGRIAISDYQGYGYFKNPAGAMNRTFQPAYMDQITCWELAEEKILTFYPEKKDKTTSIIMISVMLTVGKIAVLPHKLRKEQRQYIKECHRRLFSKMKVKGSFSYLSIGYQLKTIIFLLMPRVYLFLYHFN